MTSTTRGPGPSRAVRTDSRDARARGGQRIHENLWFRSNTPCHAHRRFAPACGLLAPVREGQLARELSVCLGELFALAERVEHGYRAASELERDGGLARMPAVPSLDDRRVGGAAQIVRIPEGSSCLGRGFRRTPIAASAGARARVSELELDLAA